MINWKCKLLKYQKQMAKRHKLVIIFSLNQINMLKPCMLTLDRKCRCYVRTETSLALQNYDNFRFIYFPPFLKANGKIEERY